MLEAEAFIQVELDHSYALNKITQVKMEPLNDDHTKSELTEEVLIKDESLQDTIPLDTVQAIESILDQNLNNVQLQSAVYIRSLIQNVRTRASDEESERFAYKKFKCASCDYKSLKKKQVHQLVLQKHSEIGQYRCDICLFKTSHYITLKYHRKIHNKREC